MNKKNIFLCMIILMNIIGIFEIDSYALDLRKNGFLVQEPVFSSQAYLYESGKQHDITVVLVHGVGSEGIKTWDYTVPVLEKKFHVLTFDLPGFGRSTSKNELYSPHNYAKFVQWVISKYAKKEVYLVGHSMGGAISICYAGTYPDSIKRLILADAAGIIHRVVFSKNTTSLSTQGMVGYFADALRKINRITSSTLETIDAKFMPAKVDWMLKSFFFRKNVLGGNTQAIAAMAMINTNLAKEIGAITVPTLLVWGEKDNIAPVRTGYMLSANIKQSEFNIIPGEGHSPMLEAPKKFNPIVVKWLTNEIGANKKDQTGTPDTLTKLVLKNKNDKIIKGGYYKEIIIKDCQRIKLFNVYAKKIYIENSRVEITTSEVDAENAGIECKNSIVLLTGSQIKALDGIVCLYSRLDLAGVKIIAQKKAVHSKGKSTVVFSVCHMKSEKNDKYVHGIQIFNESDSL